MVYGNGQSVRKREFCCWQREVSSTTNRHGSGQNTSGGVQIKLILSNTTQGLFLSIKYKLIFFLYQKGYFLLLFNINIILFNYTLLIRYEKSGPFYLHR